MRGSASACGSEWTAAERERTSVVLVALLLLVPGMTTAQVAVDDEAVPRTPWGAPDLQGIWNNQTPVPLERPDALADQEFFTEEEAAALEKNSLEQLLDAFRANAPVEIELGGDLSEIWLETLDGKVSADRRTSLIVDPPDGKIPYTAEGQKRWDPISPFALFSFDGPEDRHQGERCLATDGLLVPNPFGGNYHHILQTPDYVVILSEVLHEVRIIPLDGRSHVRPPTQLWLGDSRGWWDGQTLVVETTNFNSRRLFLGTTEELRLVERFTRNDADTISYQLTVTDPATFARPWTLEHVLRKTDSRLFEDACHEGNYSLTNILRGARVTEAAAETQGR